MLGGRNRQEGILPGLGSDRHEQRPDFRRRRDH